MARVSHAHISSILGHVCETAGSVVCSDLVIGRIYQFADSVEYLGGPLTRGVEGKLVVAPCGQTAVERLLAEDPFADEVLRLKPDDLGQQWTRNSKFCPMHDVVQDGLALRFGFSESHRFVSVFLRCNASPSFEDCHAIALRSLINVAAAALEQSAAVVSGRKFDTSVGSKLLLAHSHSRRVNALESLTNTERQVIRLLRDGLTEREIAGRLSRSQHTVHVHVKNIYRRLGVSKRRELFDLFTMLESDEEAPETNLCTN